MESSRQTPTASEDDFMSNFSAPLIHRVMLSDPADFHKLTTSGDETRSPTLSFFDLLKAKGYVNADIANSIADASDDASADIRSAGSSESQIASTVQRAFHDILLSQIQTTTTYQPLHPLLLEMHATLRSLIPNRKDLHHDDRYLNDDAIKAADGDTLIETLGLVFKIGEALAWLESEERSQTSKEWIGIAKNAIEICGLSERRVSCMEEEEGMKIDFQVQVNNDFEESEGNGEDVQIDLSNNVSVSLGYSEFAVASAEFLHKKAQQCKTDVMDFQLAHVLAPRIQALGKAYMMKTFRTKFGIQENQQSNQSLPHLKAWLEETITNSEYAREELSSSEELRGAAVLQTGWVDQILFRTPRDFNANDGDGNGGDFGTSDNEASPPPFYMPEVLNLDVQAVGAIRMTAKMSVVGSVLALHASTVAGGGAGTKLKENPLDLKIEECRKDLIGAMANRNTMMKGQEKYEEAISDAVIRLARVLKNFNDPGSDFSSNSEEILRSRTVAVMRMEDPVIKLLDNRMRNVFRDMMMFHPSSQMASDAHRQVPTSIRTGRKLFFLGPVSGLTRSEEERKQNGSTGEGTFGAAFKKYAKDEFSKRGFSFYATELADASLTASRIINLSLNVYGSLILEPVFQDICRKDNNSA